MPYASSSLVLLLGDNQVLLEKLMKTMMKKQHLVFRWAMGLTGVLSPEQQYKRSCLRLRMDIAFVSVVCVRARM